MITIMTIIGILFTVIGFVNLYVHVNILVAMAISSSIIKKSTHIDVGYIQPIIAITVGLSLIYIANFGGLL